MRSFKRRKKAKLDSVDAYIISPEDFIMNKLARPDRGAVDKQDMKSVLVMREGKLDNRYLTQRAQQTGVLTLLHTNNIETQQ